jgi:glycosyltransferase involved in cell wall biosynthesis
MPAGTTGALVALLGARDEPTDAVEDYCGWLGKALGNRGVALEIRRVDWPAQGWRRALAELDAAAAGWRGRWVLVQYSPLAWSRRSLPRRLPGILRALRRRGARVAVLFHDAGVTAVRSGAPAWMRLGDRVRRLWQRRLLRLLADGAERTFCTVAPEIAGWLGAHRATATLLPAGANIPAPEELGLPAARPENPVPVIAIFGITGLPAGERELQTLERALRRAKTAAPRFRVVAFGRGTDQAAQGLARVAAACGVEIDVRGLIAAEEITRALAAADVQLFLRGGVSSRRGTAAAGLACGLPIVAFRGPETAPPVTAAGVHLAPEGDAEAMGDALSQLLGDAGERARLAERSRAIYREWFSWESIAARLLAALEREPQVR